jgi:hypothetical protein
LIIPRHIADAYSLIGIERLILGEQRVQSTVQVKRSVNIGLARVDFSYRILSR